MAYSFAFSLIAKTLQVRLQKGADIEHLAELDQMYWLMLSCAVTAMGAEGEPVARALDTDNDGRVRVPEILTAIEWLKPRLRDFDILFNPAEGLSIDELAETEEGALLKRLLKRLAPEGLLTPQTMGKAFDDFRTSLANGDGVVPATLIPLGEVMLTITGGVSAVDGSLGLSKASLDAFEAAVKAYDAWAAAQPAETLPEGIEPASATAAVQALKQKIDDFFLQCELLRYNPAAIDAMPSPKQLSELADAPIVLPSATARTIPFEEGVNPTCVAQMATVAQLAKALDSSAETLTPELWHQVQAAVQPFAAWVSAKPNGADLLATLDRTSLDDGSLRATLEKVLAEDEAQAPLAAAFGDLQRLMTLRLGFLRFLRNFVNVEGLYPPSEGALFQTGTLYMDGRACSLCFPIEQAAAAHAKAAEGSNCCLVYCTLSRPSEKKTRTICAVFTAGSAEPLAVGRNGVFFDLEGKDWEATLVHLQPNPMGLAEAFFAPWRKVGKAFTEGVRKLIASKGDAATASMVAKAENASKGTGSVPANSGAMMASVATLGIALSFVATAVTGILAALTNTPFWKIGLAVLGIVCIVSVPNVILTWFRLRSRNLAPILNASGWAVNRRIGLTPGLGRFFTQRTTTFGRRFVPAPALARPRYLLRWICVGAVLGLLVTAGWYFFCPTSPRNREKEPCECPREVEVEQIATPEQPEMIEAPATTECSLPPETHQQ